MIIFKNTYSGKATINGLIYLNKNQGTAYGIFL